MNAAVPLATLALVTVLAPVLSAPSHGTRVWMFTRTWII